MIKQGTTLIWLYPAFFILDIFLALSHLYLRYYILVEPTI